MDLPETNRRPNDRAYRHEMEDGVIEIFMAVVFLTSTLTVAEPAFTWMVVLPILFARKVIHRIRIRLTYPRIGYVQSRRDEPSELFRGILVWTCGVFLAVGVALFASGSLVDPSAWRRAAPVLAALLCSGGFIYAAKRSRLKRYLVFCLISLCWGAVLSWSPVPRGYERVQLFLGGMAVVGFISGLVLMRLFVQRYPVIDEGEATDA